MNRPGSADDRDDSSKTTPATDMQAEDACGPDAGGNSATGNPPQGEGGQARGARRDQDPGTPTRSEEGPSESRARTAMKQESRTGEGR